MTHTVRYDAPPADVHAMLTDPAFRERATLAQGATHVEVTVTGGAVTIDFHRPNDDVPGFARKVIGGSHLHARQHEEWDDVEAAFSITTEGIPAGITGTRRLVADGDGTLDTFEGESKAHIPLLGGKIEKLMADKLRHGWDNEHEVGTGWLAGER